jgi:hypothetical protein
MASSVAATVDALPLDVIGDAIAKVSVAAYVAGLELQRSQQVRPKPVARRARPRPASSS